MKSRNKSNLFSYERKGLIKFIRIPRVSDDCYLYFAQKPDHLPFTVKRIYFIKDAHPDLPRGYHAHYKNRQIIFCLQGSIRLILNDGFKKDEILLDNPEIGVLLDRLTWHEMHDFKKGTILLVLASDPFEEKDYIREYKTFKEAARQKINK